eukprot:6213783-Pleurochrysis_carterae.AAC.4
MISISKAEGEEDSDTEMDIERQEGRREMEKSVHGIQNGDVIGGPANERRIRHATREENKPFFIWTYLYEGEQMSMLSETGGGRDYKTCAKRGM